MKEFTNVTGRVTSFAGCVKFFFPSWISCIADDLNVFQKFPETIFTPKEWFLSKKEPKEGERVTFMKE